MDMLPVGGHRARDLLSVLSEPLHLFGLLHGTRAAGEGGVKVCWQAFSSPVSTESGSSQRFLDGSCSPTARQGEGQEELR